MKSERLLKVAAHTPGPSGPGIGETVLRDRAARRAMEAGGMPARRPDSIWGGPGAGASCSVCRVPVNNDEVELEVEFHRDDGLGVDKHHVHVGCFAAWEAELRKRESADRPILNGSGRTRQNAARDDAPRRRGPA